MECDGIQGAKLQTTSGLRFPDLKSGALLSKLRCKRLAPSTRTFHIRVEDLAVSQLVARTRRQSRPSGGVHFLLIFRIP